MSDHINTQDELLDFESAHESPTSTILLIHGAGASGLEWDIVQPHLSSYHLLMPSLFTPHSVELARKVATITIVNTMTSSKQPNWQPAYIHLLAALIKSKARNGKAHIAGLSMGASLALAFATSHPDLTLSVFTSGLPAVKEPPSPSSLKHSLMHTGLLAVNKVQDILVSPATAQRLLNGEVAMHPGGWDGKGQRTTSELLRIMMDIVAGFKPLSIFDVTWDLDVARPLRVFILAATRTKWWMPVGDSVDWAVEVAKLLCSVDRDTGVSTQEDEGVNACLLQVKALEAKRMFHPWSRQAPAVFAQCILAAAEGSPLPASDVTEVWSHSVYR